MDENDTIVPLDLEVCRKFRDLEEFEEHFKKTCTFNFVQFFKIYTRTIDSVRKKNITRHLNPDLKTNFIHNHVVAEQLYKQLPQSRKLPDDIRADIKKLLYMKTNKHMLRTDLERKLNQTVTLKDLRNLQQDSTDTKNNIQMVSERIQSRFGIDCHLLIDEDNIFKGLFFCSEQMRDSLTAYPEVVFLDATYKLLPVIAPIYIFLNIDGNGESTIVGVCILMCEDQDSLMWFLESFKEQQPAASGIRNIRTDKDLTEREVLWLCFPDSLFHICIFHILKIFRREITCDHFKFSSNTKDLILDLLQKLVYSKPEKEFEILVNEIKGKSVRVMSIYKIIGLILKRNGAHLLV